jgi:hypothetical protein
VHHSNLSGPQLLKTMLQQHPATIHIYSFHSAVSFLSPIFAVYIQAENFHKLKARSDASNLPASSVSIFITYFP